MSKTVFVDYQDRGFWVYDVVQGVFLKHLIDAALLRLDNPMQAWLADAIADWRVSAVVPDSGVAFDRWSLDQINTIIELAGEACDVLSTRDRIPAEEFTSWPILDDLRIHPRGLPYLNTWAAIRLGRAITELLSDTLPNPPWRTRWYFGPDDEPDTIPYADSA